jgi:hypothetical protein
MTILPPPEEASRITSFLQDHLRWSAFWDKRDGVWRIAEDDPDSDLYAECSDVDTVISYITAHSRRSPLRTARSRIRCRCQSVRSG